MSGFQGLLLHGENDESDSSVGPSPKLHSSFSKVVMRKKKGFMRFISHMPREGDTPLQLETIGLTIKQRGFNLGVPTFNIGTNHHRVPFGFKVAY